MDTSVIITLIGSITTTIALLIKVHQGNKNRKKDSTDILKIITPFKKQLEDLTEDVKYLKERDDFKYLLSETIRQKTTQITTYATLTDKYKNILLAWSISVEELAFKFYYTKSRKNKKELDNTLTSTIKKYIVDMSTYQDNLVEEIRIQNQKEICFSDFMCENSKVSSKLFLLVDRLIQNGLNRQALVTLFSSYIEDILNANIDGFIRWQQLDIKQTGLNNKI